MRGLHASSSLDSHVFFQGKKCRKRRHGVPKLSVRKRFLNQHVRVQRSTRVMWQMRYYVLRLPCLLAAVALVFPSVTSRPNDGPIQAALRLQSERPTPESHWEWNSSPNPNATDHLIFNSVSSLLQRWPNGLRRNGASYVTLDLAYITKKKPLLYTRSQCCPRDNPQRDYVIPWACRSPNPSFTWLACVRL